MISAGRYVHGFVKYWGVESWPSVRAEIIDVGGDVTSFPSQNRFGTSSTTIDSRFAEFRYTVGSQTYRSTTVSPDGGGLPLNSLDRPWRAFYNPSSPDTAVLIPVSFQGTGLLIAATFSGILVFVHLWFTVPTPSPRDRQAKQDGE